MENANPINPIFVVGMNGSGTTMLLDCLNNHSQIYGLRRESRIIPTYIAKIRSYGDLNVNHHFFRLLKDLRNEIILKIINKGEEIPLPKGWSVLHRNLASALNSTFEYFALKENKTRWCDKTPVYALYMLSIAELFPHAKFVHMIRDGRDCVASLNRRWGYHPEIMIYRWKKRVREGRRQGRQLGENRYFEIFYEELTEAPERCMKNLCEFLSVPFEEALLKTSRIRLHTGTNARRIARNKKNWRTYFNEKTLLKIEKIAGKELNGLGYETRFKDFDVNPLKIKLNYLMCRGYAKEYVSSLKKRVEMRKDLRSIVCLMMSRLKTRDRL